MFSWTRCAPRRINGSLRSGWARMRIQERPRSRWPEPVSRHIQPSRSPARGVGGRSRSAISRRGHFETSPHMRCARTSPKWRAMRSVATSLLGALCSRYPVTWSPSSGLPIRRQSDGARRTLRASPSRTVASDRSQSCRAMACCCSPERRARPLWRTRPRPRALDPRQTVRAAWRPAFRSPACVHRKGGMVDQGPP